jgi:hypothetical protein
MGGHLKVTKLVLHGAERLSDEEQGFLVLAGQLSDEITMLSKLLQSSFAKSGKPTEMKANSVLIVLLAKTLTTKLWQGWELIDKLFHGAKVSSAPWLRENKALTNHLRAMKKQITSDPIYENVRNQFGCHYDLEPIAKTARSTIKEHGFEILYGDRPVNSFYLTSEVVTWSSILGATEPDQFQSAYTEFIHKIAARSGEFERLFNLVMEAFCTHVVDDLGGELVKVSESRIRSVVCTKQAKLPVFSA